MTKYRSTEVSTDYEASQAKRMLGWRLPLRPLLAWVCSKLGHRMTLAGVDSLAVPRFSDEVCERCGETEWSQITFSAIVHEHIKSGDAPNDSKSKDPEPVDEIDFHGCPAIGVGGYHSEGYAGDGGCAWCGAVHERESK